MCENTYIINSEMERTSKQVRMWERTSIERWRNGTKIEPFCLSASPISFLVCHVENQFSKKNHQRTFHYDLTIITTIHNSSVLNQYLFPSILLLFEYFFFFEKPDKLISEVKKFLYQKIWRKKYIYFILRTLVMDHVELIGFGNSCFNRK